MDKAELLSTLTGHAAKYEQHRQYIEKAKQAGQKFSSAVVEKVILDHDIKSAQVADLVNPLLPRLLELVATLEADKEGISSSKGTVDDQIMELELRQAIGEIADDEFETQVADLRGNASGANEKIAAIDVDLGELNAGHDRWRSLAEPHGHYKAPDAPADEVHHSARVDIHEDVSSVFAGEAPAQVRVSDVQDEIAIETSESGDGEEDGDAASADVQFSGGVDISVGGEDNPNDVAEVVAATEVDVEIGGDPESDDESAASVSPGVPQVSSENADRGSDSADVADGSARRALLIYQESTAEEQIYPFANDQLTIGRGRENDIQIKNDSKVSRYHCKLFRRGNNFYVEDIKSSNGTLVNGELITDRRLFGGEEIVIGETYFRFRIME